MTEPNTSICGNCHTNLPHPLLSTERDSDKDTYWCERFVVPTAGLLSRQRSAVEYRVRHRRGER